MHRRIRPPALSVPFPAGATGTNPSRRDGLNAEAATSMTPKPPKDVPSGTVHPQFVPGGATALLKLHAPKPSSTTDAQHALVRRPAEVADFEAALPRRSRAAFLARTLLALHYWRAGGARQVLVCDVGACGHEVPQQNAAVVAAGRQDSALRVGPLYAVYGAGMALQLK